jgi:DNA-directed RNA polymerase subunit omega
MLKVVHKMTFYETIFFGHILFCDKEKKVARITIEDCLEQVPNRFLLVHMAAQRVRQLRDGSQPLVYTPKNEMTVVALREIAAKKVAIKKDDKPSEEVPTESPS